jgi:hypothetical protein
LPSGLRFGGGFLAGGFWRGFGGSFNARFSVGWCGFNGWFCFSLNNRSRLVSLGLWSDYWLAWSGEWIGA